MIDPAAIFAHDFGQPEQCYLARDAILYALGLGLGADPLDQEDLRFLDERALSVMPTFAVTLCSPGMWIRNPALGVDFGKLVHLAQYAEFPAPLPAAANVRGEAEVISLTDRGEGKGAVLVLERRISDAATGKLYCRLHQTLLLRGDGGFGGVAAMRLDEPMPTDAPDTTATFATSPRAALIYRLSGDWNPLHLDPQIAAQAGFSRPILQGLASYGIAGAAISRALGKDPAALSKLACRFSGVVLPGDELSFKVWKQGEASARFCAFVGERKVLDEGKIEWRSA
ncbi:MaoC/PaaZ C-terminal domain-containing protein [Novosphingobium sp. MMS21-SN21R]|uniref:MaoC/PaaZ C-terminal domain-containing protein n=1 Tax=Novosphingobium sp. MMS21-SN21R TaxID=2969298 RepID=UPI00288814FD|nr:MaoC/PaaZ C-terminal domain-containing protein [Novosphingobium sp. MMS21-SN21R]MDT0508453.1 MaoC/PaaZ C-terminal domain-containing protein [Novosphingobium sp. MMS21-SN21R]